MKKVIILFVITVIMGLGLTKAQPPIDIAPKKTQTSKPAPKKENWETVPTVKQKPMTESERMEQNYPTTQKQVPQPQPIVCPQPYQNFDEVVVYQWKRKMANDKKYTILLKVYPNRSHQNSLVVTVEDKTNEIEENIFGVSSIVSNPYLEQSGDWKKMIFTYMSYNGPVTIEIENLY